LATGSALTFNGTETLALTASGGAALNVGANTGKIFLYADNSGTTLGALTDIPLRFSVNSAEQMRLNSTGLGIGTSSPAYKLDVSGTAGYNAYIYDSPTTGGVLIGGSSTRGLITSNSGTKGLALQINGVTALDIDTSGNLGLGFTPSAFGSTYKAIQAGGYAAFVGDNNNGFVEILNNAYASSNLVFNYRDSNAASRYSMQLGAHKWFSAASGTAGNTISFTQAMTLDASGNLGVGTTSPRAKLNLEGGSTTSINATACWQYIGSGAAASYTSSNYMGVGFGYNNAGNSEAPAFIGFTVTDASASTNGALVFATRSVTTVTAPTERARITSQGYFKASDNGTYQGSTSNYHEFSNSSADNLIKFRNSNASNPYGFPITYSAASPNGTGNAFWDCDDTGGARAALRSNGGFANYSANNVNLSDRREKTNFAPATSYLDKICAIPVQTFNYIDQNMETDGGLTLGVIAQDVQAVAPELVMESNWASKDAEPKMRLSIYQTDLQYALMKCIQEQQAIIESLKARLDAANL
jgi:hypothetical protein